MIKFFPSFSGKTMKRFIDLGISMCEYNLLPSRSSIFTAKYAGLSFNNGNSNSSLTTIVTNAELICSKKYVLTYSC